MRLINQIVIYSYILILLSGLYWTFPVQPKFIYLGFIAVSFILLLLKGNISIQSNRFLSFVLFYSILLIYMLFHILFVSENIESIDLFFSHLYCLCIFVLFYLLVHNSSIPNILEKSIFLVRLVVYYSAMLMFFEVFIPGGSQYVENAGRGDAHYNNANSAALTLALSAGLFIRTIKNNIALNLTYFIVILGIIATFSKAGGILFFILFMYQLWQNDYKNSGVSRLNFLVLFVPLLILFISVLDIFLQNIDLLEVIGTNSYNRISTFDLADESFRSRINVLPFAINKFLMSPLYGHGVGYGYVWDYNYASHNIFLFYMVDLGIIGLGLILALYYLIYRVKSYQTRVFPYLLFVSSFFSHNTMTRVPIYILFALHFLMENKENTNIDNNTESVNGT